MYRNLAVLTTAFFLCAPIKSATVQANTIVLTDEEQAECVMEGGCALVTKKQFFEALQAAMERGAADALIKCRNHI